MTMSVVFRMYMPHATGGGLIPIYCAHTAYRLEFTLGLLPYLCVGIEGSLDAASESGSIHRAGLLWSWPAVVA